MSVPRSIHRLAKLHGNVRTRSFSGSARHGKLTPIDGVNWVPTLTLKRDAAAGEEDDAREETDGIR